MIEHILLCQKMLKFFQIFLNIHNFFNFFEVFRIKLFCAARCSHVLCIIGFPIKFHIGLFMSHRCETLWENAITCFITCFMGVENLHQKISRNHRTVVNSNEVNFHQKTPTHISATVGHLRCHLRIYNFFFQNF